MKKSSQYSTINNYNKLFKFLTFDLTLKFCIIASLITILFMFIIYWFFGIIQVKTNSL